MRHQLMKMQSALPELPVQAVSISVMLPAQDFTAMGCMSNDNKAHHKLRCSIPDQNTIAATQKEHITCSYRCAHCMFVCPALVQLLQ